MKPVHELELTKIGQITRQHGYKGDLVIHLDLDFQRITETELLFIEIDGYKVPFFIEDEKFQAYKTNSALVKFQYGTEGEKIKDVLEKYVFVKSEKILEEETEEYEKIIGYEAYNFQVQIGKIADFLRIPSNPVLVIKTTDKEESLIPFNEHFIDKIDHETQRVYFELPDGLLDLNSGK